MFWYNQPSNFPCLIKDTATCYVICDHINNEGKLCDDEGRILYDSDPTKVTFIASVNTILDSLNTTHPEIFI